MSVTKNNENKKKKYEVEQRAVVRARSRGSPLGLGSFWGEFACSLPCTGWFSLSNLVSSSRQNKSYVVINKNLSVIPLWWRFLKFWLYIYLFPVTVYGITGYFLWWCWLCQIFSLKSSSESADQEPPQSPRPRMTVSASLTACMDFSLLRSPLPSLSVWHLAS